MDLSVKRELTVGQTNVYHTGSRLFRGLLTDGL